MLWLDSGWHSFHVHMSGFVWLPVHLPVEALLRSGDVQRMAQCLCRPQAHLKKCSLALPGLVYLQLNSVHCAVVSVHLVLCMSICQQGKSSVRVKLHVGPWVAVGCFVGC